MDSIISKISILLEQEKYEELEHMLRQLLAQEPTNANYLSMLAEVNFQQHRLDQAESIIDDAIGFSPDMPFLYYTKTRIGIEKGKYDDAEKSIQQAINLEPSSADYFALFANIKFTRKQYEESLGLANQALEIDPENLLALNVRGMALIELNREEESFTTINGALRQDSNIVFTHTSYGWGLLVKGDYKKALKHFKEALMNDPDFEDAREGMAEALKASYPVYRLFLKYSFLKPLSNFFLRFNPYGKLLLIRRR